jgi:hypothetical protein
MVLALLLAMSAPASAAVTLTSFTATARDDGTIRVAWAAATELETASYQLYRSEASAPADWGAPIYAVAAGGSVSPASYEYIDQAATPGQTYYYRLVDISNQGTASDHGPVSARILLPGETATNTPTATATWTGVPTATTGAGAGVPGTPTATLPPPTATRRYTNTPVISPIGTPVLSAPTSPLIAGRAAPTRLPGALVATPTRGVPLAPTAPLAVPLATATVALPPTFTPTAAVIAQAPGGAVETATPVPTREVTPIIFAASETRETTQAAAAQQDVASQDSRNTSLVLTIGGAALGLAGLLAAVLLFLRSRKG